MTVTYSRLTRLPLLAVILRPLWTNTPPTPELLPTTIILATLLLFTLRGAPGKLLATPTFFALRPLPGDLSLKCYVGRARLHNRVTRSYHAH